ncbi:FAD-dependent oxidoreductase [Candidatus Poribacteria bacterium]|nr:FAD-dependent oxidoreductase [Candidatus Poribacteria bacterium]
MDTEVWTQVIVVGAGNAALSAAVAARERGAEVVVLEKAPRQHRGGNSALTVHMRFPYDGMDDLTPLLPCTPSEDLRRMTDRIGQYTHSDYYDDIMTVTEGKSNPELAEILVNQAVSAVRWMHSYRHTWVPTYANPVSANVVSFNGGGYGLQEQWFRIAERLGISVYYDTSAVELLQDSQGKVTGVRAKTSQGYCNFHAGAVVLACGSFESSPEMRARHLGPEWEAVKLRGVPYNTGDGLTMAMECGALPYGSWSSCHASPQDLNRPRFDVPGPDIRGDFWSRYSYPFGIMINLSGDRFIDEGETWRGLTYAKIGRAILAQPRGIAFQIFDRKHRELEVIRGYEKATGFKANTLENLAQQLDISDVAAFTHTVREFNAAVQQGEFNPFQLDGKSAIGITPPRSNWALPIDTPPFEGFPVVCGMTFTFGGLRITSEAQVVHTMGYPISGLYAAGEMVGGLWHGNYPSGAGMMAGTVFGRISGTNAAEEAFQMSR